MRCKLVQAPDERNVVLRQSYDRIGKYAFFNHNRYAHAQQMKLARSTLITSIFSVHGNPYDGHTLCQRIEQSERLTKIKVNDAYVDKAAISAK